MRLFKTRPGSRAVDAAPKPVRLKDAIKADYLVRLTQPFEESWEAPASEQFEHAFQAYVDDLLAPAEALDDELAEKKVLLRGHVQRMVEIAPDLFDKAMRRTPFETGFFIEQENGDV